MAKTIRCVLAAVLVLGSLAGAVRAECNPADYEPVTQADLIRHRDAYQGKKVRVTGSFLFAGSDFCYQIRKTKINTRDYFCFALGTPSLLRFYLKKDHPQADELLNLDKGAKITAYGLFDYMGNDYNFMVVEGFEVKGAE